ncbi:carbonic anhydrase [Rhizobium tubonense]|uniref:Carbonic anhydrase n=1 Tax=Rhizobium tubonense TaxID=484088 RepID=A0A2W4CTK0_9HYPH|nr:carbonic anhydrase [Rhizobium tubonense]PZM15722.1 carbonic anhydrase [Rhizobium tubonense]
MIAKLLSNNKVWAAQKTSANPNYFRDLSAIQKPDYLWIGCSDSRVPANVITGLEPGEVFVQRNVANLVHPTDLNLLSVVEFAVEVLGVRQIIVCGHYGCGGIRAAMDGESHGIIDHWLQPIRDVADSNFSCLEHIENEDKRLERLCELSVIAQVDRLARTPIIRSAWRANKQIVIHGWIYGLTDGLLTDLRCSIGPEIRLRS